MGCFRGKFQAFLIKIAFCRLMILFEQLLYLFPGQGQQEFGFDHKAGQLYRLVAKRMSKVLFLPKL